MKRRRLALVVCAGLLAIAARLNAASISGDITSGTRQGKPDSDTQQLFVFSERTTVNGQAAPAGPNQSSRLHYFLRFNNPIIQDPLPQATHEGHTVNIVVGPREYGPSLTGGSRPKVKPGLDNWEEAYSFSGDAITGFAQGKAQARERQMTASGELKPGSGGRAAAAAFDPIAMAPGLYPYDPVIDMAFDLADATFAGAVFAAGDDRFDTESLMFEPVPFWRLTITQERGGPFQVSFRIDPASKSTITGLSALQDAFGQALGDLEIENAVRTAVLASNGVLTDFHPFPASTRYYVDANVAYSFGTEVGIEAIPEPATLALAFLGIALLAARVVRADRRRAKANATRARRDFP